jgi:hypothetical protein
MESLDQIIAEMRRKPDAHYLSEWLHAEADRDAEDLQAAIEAYWEALED